VIQIERCTVKRRILIVEDDEALRVLAESLVMEDGYESLTAGSVEEGKALIDAGGFDILLTDLQLHDQMTGGIAIAEYARAALASVPVIYSSGAGVTDGTRALFVTGAVFLPKPYTHADLTAAIAAVRPSQSPRTDRLHIFF